MEQYQLATDLAVYFIDADSFPDGVLAAHQSLHALVPFAPERKYFGLSRPGAKGIIEYKAGATALFPGEATAWHLPFFVLRAGNYTSIVIAEYRKQLAAIGDAFRQLVQHPAIDPDGICVEWYYNDKDVRCMVRLQY